MSNRSVIDCVNSSIGKIIAIGESDNTNSTKGREIKREALRIKKGLTSRSSSLVIKRTNFSTFRREIKRLKVRHHAFDYHVKKIAKRHSKHKSLILPMVGMDTAAIEDRIKALESKGDQDLNKSLKSLKVYSDAYYIVNLTSSEYAKVQELQDKKVAEKYDNNSQVHINPTSIQKIARQLMNDSNKYRKLVGLGLATGRRLNEITYSGSFIAIGEYKMLVSGISKGGDDKRKEDHEIYTLVEAKKVEKEINKLRQLLSEIIIKAKNIEHKNGMSAAMAKINSSSGPSANRVTRDCLSIISNTKKWNFKDTRGINVRVAAELFFDEWQKDDESKTVTDFFKMQLIHDNFSTQMNYKNFVITDAKIDTSNLEGGSSYTPKHESITFNSGDEMLKHVSKFDEKFKRLRGKNAKEFSLYHSRIKNYIRFYYIGDFVETDTFTLSLKDLYKKARSGGVGIDKEKAIKYWEMINDGREEENAISKQEKA